MEYLLQSKQKFEKQKKHSLDINNLESLSSKIEEHLETLEKIDYKYTVLKRKEKLDYIKKLRETFEFPNNKKLLEIQHKINENNKMLENLESKLQLREENLKSMELDLHKIIAELKSLLIANVNVKTQLEKYNIDTCLVLTDSNPETSQTIQEEVYNSKDVDNINTHQKIIKQSSENSIVKLKKRKQIANYQKNYILQKKQLKREIIQILNEIHEIYKKLECFEQSKNKIWKKYFQNYKNEMYKRMGVITPQLDNLEISLGNIFSKSYFRFVRNNLETDYMILDKNNNVPELVQHFQTLYSRYLDTLETLYDLTYQTNKTSNKKKLSSKLSGSKLSGSKLSGYISLDEVNEKFKLLETNQNKIIQINNQIKNINSQIDFQKTAIFQTKSDITKTIQTIKSLQTQEEKYNTENKFILEDELEKHMFKYNLKMDKLHNNEKTDIETKLYQLRQKYDRISSELEEMVTIRN